MSCDTCINAAAFACLLAAPVLRSAICSRVLVLLELCCMQPVPCMVTCFIASITLFSSWPLQAAEAFRQEAKDQAAAVEARATALQVPPYSLHYPPPWPHMHQSLPPAPPPRPPPALLSHSHPCFGFVLGPVLPHWPCVQLMQVS